MLYNGAMHRGNVQFEASKLKVLHEKCNHGRADGSQYVAHHLASFITETAWYDTNHAHSPYQYEEKAAHQGRESKYTCKHGGHIRRFPSCTWLFVSPRGRMSP